MDGVDGWIEVLMGGLMYICKVGRWVSGFIRE